MLRHLFFPDGSIPNAHLARNLWRSTCLIPALVFSLATAGHAQTNSAPASVEDVRELQSLVQELAARDARLEAEVAELRAEVRAQRGQRELAADVGDGSAHITPAVQTMVAAAAPPDVSPKLSEQTAASGGQALQNNPPAPVFTESDRGILNYLKGNTINLGFDGYYSYNFNAPVGRVNLLRSYDVLSNAFSVNQASVVFEHAPDPSAGKRFGVRLDLQFGQATETLQGNPANEFRPDVYRNIFQVYGTYVAPVGRGLTIDFGKWGSSLGIEGNYTKDQINYSRAYWFDFLPFYHMGLRANLPINNKLAVNYWVVNGTQQTEPTNGFKDQLFGVVLTPHKTVSWTVNYYFGQEHPDVVQIPNSGPIPLQPGLNFVAIRPAPDGRLHIFDSYATWQATPKLTLAGEGDYVLQRLWRHAAAGESSAPSIVAGGAAYARYQFTPHLALGARTEYLSDRDGFFSGVPQALKEVTATFNYKIADGFLMRYEWRRDFSNQPFFLTDVQGVRSDHQTTATVGLIWWFGRKEGAW